MTLGKWLAIVGTLGFGSAVALGSQGCTVSTGDGGDVFPGTDASTVDTGTDAGTGTDAASDPCNECLFGSCSGQDAVCFQDSDCQSIYACATAPGCTTTTCVNNCFLAKGSDVNNPTPGQAKYLALSNCDHAAQCGTCAATCNTQASACTTPDAGADSGPVDAGNTCDQCVGTSCSAQKGACLAGSDCDAYNQCLAACQDAACLDKCGTDHPTGKAASTALADCTTSQCKTQCGL